MSLWHLHFNSAQEILAIWSLGRFGTRAFNDASDKAPPVGGILDNYSYKSRVWDDLGSMEELKRRALDAMYIDYWWNIHQIVPIIDKYHTHRTDFSECISSPLISHSSCLHPSWPTYENSETRRLERDHVSTVIITWTRSDLCEDRARSLSSAEWRLRCLSMHCCGVLSFIRIAWMIWCLAGLVWCQDQLWGPPELAKIDKASLILLACFISQKNPSSTSLISHRLSYSVLKDIHHPKLDRKAETMVNIRPLLGSLQLGPIIIQLSLYRTGSCLLLLPGEGWHGLLLYWCSADGTVSSARGQLECYDTIKKAEQKYSENVWERNEASYDFWVTA